MCVIHTLARQLKLPVFWLKFTYLSIFQALFDSKKKAVKILLTIPLIWNWILEFLKIQRFRWGMLGTFPPTLYTEKAKHAQKLKEIYIEHLCIYQLDSTINILYHF